MERDNQKSESQENKKESDYRKEKIKKWLKEPYNLALIGILIFSFLLLFYYFSLTKNQTLWYDEAEYMSTAKLWAFGVPYEIHQERPPLFPFLAFLFYKLNLTEATIKFLLGVLPLWLSVLFIFFLVKEMYGDKRLALITTFILSLSWIHIFYAMRLMTDSTGFLFGVLSFYCFWKGYVNNKGTKYMWLTGFFIALSFLSRLTGILYGVIIVLFLFFTENFKFFKKKQLWIVLLTFLLTISPYLLWSYLYYNNPLAFRSGYTGINYPDLGWWMLNLVYDYPEFVFFIFFLIGLLTLIPMFLSFDLLIRRKEKKYDGDFFMFLTIIFTLAFFIYFLRQGENRWLIAMSIGIFAISAKGIIYIFEIIKKDLGKYLALFFLIFILVSGAYFQLKHADMIIKNKIGTYNQVKEAALWIKENSNPDDIIVTSSTTQTAYYSERKVISFYNSSAREYYTPEQYDAVIDFYKPRYLVISLFEPSVPQWTYSYPQRNESRFKPVKAWFSDPEQKQPLLIIYAVEY